MMRTRVLLSSLCVLGLAAAAGCGGTGTVSVQLTDAPRDDFARAEVTIERIELLGGSDEGKGGDEGEGRGEGRGGRVVLRDTPARVSLLDLANSVDELVAETAVPAGTYKELRFVVSGGYVQLKPEAGGQVYATDGYALPEGVTADGQLHMPSAKSSGFKVKLEERVSVESGDEKVVLVDFDVSQSFGKARGSSGRWVMSPVIRGGELTFSGSVGVALAQAPGVLLPLGVSLGDFQALLTKPVDNPDLEPGAASERVALTDPDGDGVYEAHFRYMFPQTYALSFAAPAPITGAITAPATPAAVTVEAGRRTDAGLFTLTGYTRQ
jgi:hypothetical protein